MDARPRYDGLLSLAHLHAGVRLELNFVEKASGANGGHGDATGFLVRDIAHAKSYLVTCRHVVDPTFRPRPKYGLALESVSLRGTFADTSTGRLLNEWHLRFDRPEFRLPANESDVAVLSFAEAQGAEWLEGGEQMRGSANHLGLDQIAAPEEIDRLHLADDAYVTGFPGVGGSVSSEPILVTGTVASNPALPASVGGRSFPQEILLQAFSWGGMSGAPVMSHVRPANMLKVVGVNTGHFDLDGSAAGVLSRFARIDNASLLFD